MFATDNPVRIVNIHPIERWASIVGGGLLAAFGIKKRSPAGGAMILAGTEMLGRGISGRCFLYQALGIRTVDTGQGDATTIIPFELGIRARATVTIDRSRAEVYAFWRDLSHLPQFM